MPSVHLLTPLTRIKRVPLSGGAKLLAAALTLAGAKVTFGSEYRDGALNVGWGRGGGDLNKQLPPHKLWELAKAKEAGVPVVPFTVDFEATQGDTWFGRALRHTQGTDIFVLGPGVIRDRVPPRDFWTKKIDKRREYRVHVFDGLAVRSGTKRKENGDFEDTQPIWNLSHGFQIRYEHSAPVGAKNVAKAAVEAMDLDFAAVDVIEDQNGRFYMLEVNCRPGLHGKTVDKYVEKILARAGRE